MGGSLAKGLLKNGTSRYEVTVSNPSAAPLEVLKSLGAEVTHDNVGCVRGADIVVLAVKPWLVEKVISEIKPVLDYQRMTIAVIAASVSCAELKKWLEKDDTVPATYICMPNTAMSVMKSVTFVVPADENCPRESTRQLCDMFDEVGSSVVIDEQHLPAATALASCGIAFAMRYIRASEEGGVELGFKASAAREIVVKTIEGACAILSAGGSHPESEIDKVTTPGGITIKGLNEMEHRGFTSAVVSGLKACVKK